ncbi:2OG-Fe(II) oxygenase [Pseudomaricurvus sp. HS19]|uniref:prolyl hydroxylase family protein n=1 Tax=Pseudomaricurvus sp. HS19 TaxID=2692626 RepID=UPI00136D43F5|nr:2OG-Fe(II) oxygenase [Pseudomaricurvus sp. HS19]MYM62344.1 oxidoreductase [Pseudomaricurvus sp. HS19]
MPPLPTPHTDDFYVVAYEPGAENPALPTWANRHLNPAGLIEDYPTARISRQPVADVPGAFQLLNVLTPKECEALIGLSEALGYLPDAAVSLPRRVRHNDNVVWVTDADTDRIIWQRVAGFLQQDAEDYDGNQPLGINARFRFYRYGEGDYFAFHTDGAWPGSRVQAEELVANAYPDRYSCMTFLIFLSDDFDGGETRFLVDGGTGNQRSRSGSERRQVDVRTPAGGVLCFPHGMHPWHCVHSSVPITRGTKYVIRTDTLFAL